MAAKKPVAVPADFEARISALEAYAKTDKARDDRQERGIYHAFCILTGGGTQENEEALRVIRKEMSHEKHVADLTAAGKDGPLRTYLRKHKEHQARTGQTPEEPGKAAKRAALEKAIAALDADPDAEAPADAPAESANE